MCFLVRRLWCNRIYIAIIIFLVMYLMPQELKSHCSFPTEVVDLILKFPSDSGSEAALVICWGNGHYLVTDFSLKREKVIGVEKSPC